MDKALFAVGNIICDPATDKKFRIIYISDAETVLCEMETTRFLLTEHSSHSILSLIAANELIVSCDNNIPIFDIEQLSTSIKNRYLERKKMIQEVVSVYQPTFTGLAGKKPKPEIKRIISKYSLTKSSFWRTCTQYFQSGMKDYSLIDAKAFGINKGKSYKYNEKPGRKSEYLINTGTIQTDEIQACLEEALKEYKSGRQKTLKSAFDYMNTVHFTKTEIINGIATMVLLPESQRPTWWQFYYYANKHINKEEKDIIKTSAQEHRNDKRLLLSDSLNGICGPGDMVEIDACEADVSLVSMTDPNKTIGRPIVYFMIDVFTRIILAVSVAFDNNSILGVTNLFLNLADNKKEYCNRYGMGFDNDNMWPSNIIPRRLRVDRGAEFKSVEFGRICNELGIEKQLVSGGTGSLKGIVEQSFHQMHLAQNVHLENYGLIEKRHDSNHHKEATLNIEQYTKMIINFVLMHNQKFQEDYPLTKEMLENDIKPIPAFLWQYGVKKYGQPRPIPVKEQYLFNLMIPIKAKLSRRGISYKELWYYPENDPMISRDMFNAAKKSIPFECRMDMRNISNVYYLRDGKLITAPLNKNLTGNADYSGITMKQLEDYLKKKRQMKAEGAVYNEELSAFTYAVNANVVEEAKKPALSDSKNIRPAREIEKQKKSSSNNIAARLKETPQPKENPQIEAMPVPITEQPEQKQTPTVEKKDEPVIYTNLKDALEAFEDEIF